MFVLESSCSVTLISELIASIFCCVFTLSTLAFSKSSCFLFRTSVVFCFTSLALSSLACFSVSDSSVPLKVLTSFSKLSFLSCKDLTVVEVLSTFSLSSFTSLVLLATSVVVFSLDSVALSIRFLLVATFLSISTKVLLAFLTSSIFCFVVSRLDFILFVDVKLALALACASVSLLLVLV